MTKDLETLAENEKQSEEVSFKEVTISELKTGAKIGAIMAAGAGLGAGLGYAFGFIYQFATPSVTRYFYNEGKDIFKNVQHKMIAATTFSSSMIAMGYVMVDQISRAIQKAADGDHTHLGVLAATNTISLGAELFRSGYRMGKRNSKNKKEEE